MELNRSEQQISQYLSDESNAFTAKAETIRGIFYPECEEDIAEAVRYANNIEISLSVSGAGTGITGARVPTHGGIVVSMERMLRARKRDGCQVMQCNGLAGDITIYFDEKNDFVHVSPGVSLSELASALPRGYIYPPDPTETLASLGGTVATNASGARCFFYGPTRKWIEGVRVVLADGEILNVRRGICLADSSGDMTFKSESGKEYSLKIPSYRMPEVKNAAGLFSAAGMDLIDLFIGSEGILGIFTEITIRIAQVAGEPLIDIGFFREHVQAMRYVERARDLKGKGLLAIEYFHESALEFLRSQFPEIPENAEAAILVEVDDGSMELMSQLADLLSECGASADWFAVNGPDIRNMKEFRHSLPDSVNSYLKQHESYKLGTDFAVPNHNFQKIMDEYIRAGMSFERNFPRNGPHWVMFGHIGDSHVHFNFITTGDMERARARELYAVLAMEAVSLGGTISAEHGVGKKRVSMDGEDIPYLKLMYGEEGLSEIARIKAVLDPKGILNPGNMVPVGWGLMRWKE